MKILSIEDEMPASSRLKKILQDFKPETEVLAILDSIEASVHWLQTHPTPELIFMDIQLADGLSFGIFEQIEVKTPVIFTTAFDEYTLKAFKVNSIDYLLKPIDIEELKQSLQKFEQLQERFVPPKLPLEELLNAMQKDKPAYKSRFLVKLGERLIAVPQDNIAYFFAEQKVVLLITEDSKKYALDYTLDELETMLNPNDFFRLNRQFIAKFTAIRQIHQYFKGKLKVEIQPTIDKEILVSREKASVFKEWLDK
jgi:DNA-binding LytR/AlgR family response regulator